MKETKTGEFWIRIGGELPSLEAVSEFVRRDHCGAINIFQGVTRNHDNGKSVTGLSYDSYDEMALHQSEVILQQTKEQFPIGAAAILHKTGNVPVGRVSMIVSVSTPHREESTGAVLSIIEQIKQDVPLWKKESFEKGTEIVSKWK